LREVEADEIKENDDHNYQEAMKKQEQNNDQNDSLNAKSVVDSDLDAPREERKSEDDHRSKK
jgi:hypothetical protein